MYPIRSADFKNKNCGVKLRYVIEFSHARLTGLLSLAYPNLAVGSKGKSKTNKNVIQYRIKERFELQSI